MHPLVRSVGCFLALKRLEPHERSRFLKSRCPVFVLDDMTEAIYNILHSNVSNINKNTMTQLRGIVKKLVNVINSPDKTSRRCLLNKYGGTKVLSILLPILLNIASSKLIDGFRTSENPNNVDMNIDSRDVDSDNASSNDAYSYDDE